MSTYALPTNIATKRDARDDGALVRDRLRGHDEAFAVFYRRYHRRVVGYCLRRTQNEALAEDLAHDTLIKALESLDEYDLDRPAWPWLKVIAHNTMIDHIRKHKREDLMERPVAEDDATEDDLTDLLAERPILAEAMSELPDRQRVAIRLRYLEDWKASEAGEFLDLSRPAVEQLLFRARRNLRDTYERLVDETAGRLAGLLIPLYRLKDTVTARFRARLNGWEFSFQSLGPAALDAVGQTAATLAVLGLAAAVAGGASTEAPRFVINDNLVPASTLVGQLKDVEGRQAAGEAAHAEATTGADNTVAGKATVASFQSPDAGLEGTAPTTEGQVFDDGTSVENHITVNNPITGDTTTISGTLIHMNCEGTVQGTVCGLVP